MRYWGAVNWNVSTVVNSDKPVAVERSMHWDSPLMFRSSGTSSTGYFQLPQ
jgi:hypothetical protein